MGTGEKVIGYVRVSTEEQGRSGVGLEAQRRAIRQACSARGWQLLRIEEDRLSGAVAPSKRPGLKRALTALERGEAAGLIVSRLDRLTRSLSGLVHIMERSSKGRWQLVSLDMGIDTTTAMGEAMANMAVTFAQLERRLIGERIKDALAVKRAQGVRLGREPGDPAVRRRIRGLRKRGHSYSEIARRLNKDGVPTGQGGKQWYPPSVRVVAADYDRAAPKQRRKRAAA